MAHYCDTNDLKLYIGQNTQYAQLTETSAGLSGDALATAVIAEVDEYMREQLEPFYEDVTAFEGLKTVTEIAVNLCFCFLLKRRSLDGLGDAFGESIVKYCEQGKNDLYALKHGALTLYKDGVPIERRETYNRTLTVYNDNTRVF